MADISKLAWLRHFRSEPSFHVLRYKSGKLTASGRGLTFWFMPMNTSAAEIPVEDRELPFLFHCRSQDFQDITVQGSMQFRVEKPEVLGARMDFSLDLQRGTYLKEPLEQLTSLFSGHAQQISAKYLAKSSIREILTAGLGDVQDHLNAEFAKIETIAEMGLRVLGLQVSNISPTAELERALQTPTRESLQQEADRATFERRATAVENERAIAENELQSQIELAKREKALLEQRGDNERRRAQDEVEAKAIEIEGRAQATRVDAAAQADRITVVEGARVKTEHERLQSYKEMEPNVLLALAAQELAGKLKSIDHLNITPDLLGPGLANLLSAGTAKLKE